jgi:hypothetical protein
VGSLNVCGELFDDLISRVAVSHDVARVETFGRADFRMLAGFDVEARPVRQKQAGCTTVREVRQLLTGDRQKFGREVGSRKRCTPSGSSAVTAYSVSTPKTRRPLIGRLIAGLAVSCSISCRQWVDIDSGSAERRDDAPNAQGRLDEHMCVGPTRSVQIAQPVSAM